MGPAMMPIPQFSTMKRGSHPYPCLALSTALALKIHPSSRETGNSSSFFITPYVRIPAERQLVDGVTGIYVAKRVFGGWSEPARVILSDPAELSLDGCEFFQDGQLWFCTIRAGAMREIEIWLADFGGSQATNWRTAGEELNLTVGLGEFHFSSDWKTVYFHSDMPGGQGGIDLYVSHLVGEAWSAPHNLSPLNTPEHDGWPYLTPDGGEIFFTCTYQGSPGIFRSRWDGER